MTTEFQTSTRYDQAQGYDAAVDAARTAGAGGPMEGFIERIADRVGAKASVGSVFGQPIERDGLTIIPVARVRWGFGGGAGSGPVAVGPGVDNQGPPENAASGTGGGGGVMADPIGYLEIGPEGATFRPITPAMPSPGFLLAAGVTATLVLRGLARLFRR